MWTGIGEREVGDATSDSVWGAGRSADYAPGVGASGGERAGGGDLVDCRSGAGAGGRALLWSSVNTKERTMSEGLSITADTKVAALLNDYPELEEVLIGMAPPFKRLRNPILRRSVAKVASLRQAAAVGRLSVDEMVNTLRAAVGQDEVAEKVSVETASYFSSEPDWFDEGRVVARLDEREVDPDTMPLKPLLLRATKMSEGEILELTTGYLPAPGIDIMKGKGFAAWSVEDGGLIRTYFSKPIG